MFVQVTNPNKKTANTFRTSPGQMFKQMRARGWNPQECKVVELRDELVNTKYTGADGKTVTNTENPLS